MLIDVNVNLSRWPTRRLPHDELEKLIGKLKAMQVSQAWAGSFDALLHKDIAGVNARLAADCQASNGLLLPFGAINPALPDWQDDVRRCSEEHQMLGVRLFPTYHGYTFEDPRFAELLALCGERGLIVQIALSMEDERTQHPLLRVPRIDPGPLKRVLAAQPRLRVVLLNAMRGIGLVDLASLAELEGVFVEIATLEGVEGLTTLLKQVPLDRILFGSHFPYFNFEAAALKLKESELAGIQREAITHANARRLLENKVK